MNAPTTDGDPPSERRVTAADYHALRENYAALNTRVSVLEARVEHIQGQNVETQANISNLRGQLQKLHDDIRNGFLAVNQTLTDHMREDAARQRAIFHGVFATLVSALAACVGIVAKLLYPALGG